MVAISSAFPSVKANSFHHQFIYIQHRLQSACQLATHLSQFQDHHLQTFPQTFYLRCRTAQPFQTGNRLAIWQKPTISTKQPASNTPQVHPSPRSNTQNPHSRPTQPQLRSHSSVTPRPHQKDLQGPGTQPNLRPRSSSRP